MDVELFSKLPNDLLKKIAVLADIEHEKDIGAYLVEKLKAIPIGDGVYEVSGLRGVPFRVRIVRESAMQQVVPVDKSLVSLDKYKPYFAEYVYVMGGVKGLEVLGLREFEGYAKVGTSFKKRKGKVVLKVGCQGTMMFYDASALNMEHFESKYWNNARPLGCI
jgi:hypothetical protein